MIFLNKQSKWFLFTIIVCLIFLNFNFVLAAFEVDSGLIETANETGYTGGAIQLGSLSNVVSKIIEIVLSFVGVIFLVLLIYGGYTWMIARGNEQQVEKAKSIIINAIIGLVIVMAAYAITALVSTLIPTS